MQKPARYTSFVSENVASGTQSQSEHPEAAAPAMLQQPRVMAVSPANLYSGRAPCGPWGCPGSQRFSHLRVPSPARSASPPVARVHCRGTDVGDGCDRHGPVIGPEAGKFVAFLSLFYFCFWVNGCGHLYTGVVGLRTARWSHDHSCRRYPWPHHRICHLPGHRCMMSGPPAAPPHRHPFVQDTPAIRTKF